MGRRADAALFTRINALRTTLADLERDLRQHGDMELADVIKRAHRELMLPAFTGAENTRGVNADAVRK